MDAYAWDNYTYPEAMLTGLLRHDFSTARLPVVLAGFAERGRLIDALSGHVRQQFLDYSRWVFGLSPRSLPIELLVYEPTAARYDEMDVEDRLRAAMCGGLYGWYNLIPIAGAEATSEWRSDRRQWNQRQADALRDALGNPFAPVAWEASWRSETVVALAAGIHFDNAFDRLPILADALEEAGCDDAEVLNHCRGPGPHARGCWVIDRARGKW